MFTVQCIAVHYAVNNGLGRHLNRLSSMSIDGYNKVDCLIPMLLNIILRIQVYIRLGNPLYRGALLRQDVSQSSTCPAHTSQRDALSISSNVHLHRFMELCCNHGTGIPMQSTSPVGGDLAKMFR